jgi:hypothetical protein
LGIARSIDPTRITSPKAADARNFGRLVAAPSPALR